MDAKRRRKRDSDVGKIQMAPMIDVVFQLLIFFLVTSEMRPTEADFTANLPGGIDRRITRVPAKEPRRVYLANDPSGGVTVSLDGTALGKAPEAFTLLLERLKRVRKDDMLLVIDGDPALTVNYIANVLDVAVEAEVPAVTFGKPRGGT